MPVGLAVLIHWEEFNMHNKTLISLFVATVTVGLTGISQAQTTAPAATATSNHRTAICDHQG